MASESKLSEIFEKHEEGLLGEWLDRLCGEGGLRREHVRDTELRETCRDFLALLRDATSRGNVTNVDASEWDATRNLLGRLSSHWAEKGMTPTETATFIFSLKQPVFTRLRNEVGKDSDALFREVWNATSLLDKLGLWTTSVYQKSRESVITRQQEEMLELSTPVVKLWNGVLALPLIGTLDSARTQVVMENLLQTIVAQGAEIAIIDITGVPMVDTLVAQHLMKTVTAARLMGADCIISGIRPQIAQTIVHLGVELGDITTKASLADAFALALRRKGLTVAAAAK